jgi:hypothetical protein
VRNVLTWVDLLISYSKRLDICDELAVALRKPSRRSSPNDPGRRRK